MLCQNFLNLCPLPPASPLNLTGWFAKPKPDPLPAAKKPSGKRLKVLHISDLHIDPSKCFYLAKLLYGHWRASIAGYTTNAEANCTSGLCCREGNVNTQSPNQTIFPAPRFGSFLWQVRYVILRQLLTSQVPQRFTFLTGRICFASNPTFGWDRRDWVWLDPVYRRPCFAWSGQPTF